jgi:hypothetical protein
MFRESFLHVARPIFRTHADEELDPRRVLTMRSSLHHLRGVSVPQVGVDNLDLFLAACMPINPTGVPITFATLSRPVRAWELQAE